ncbi:OmpA family protein [Geopsychrobacter electrodiphilus]|uniref:OmpA family protein n=1 Tax=Geopsychrobacter electrodiphilus TaxID=225196 RepID=UPI00036760DD|nr:OmpA family protein [Geopsychrobacter electrodiphilus]
MYRQVKTALWIGLLMLFFVLSGCSTPQVTPEKVAPTDELVPQFTALNEAILAARQNQLDMLSPHWFAQAGLALERARKGISLGEGSQKVLGNIAYAKTYLGKAEDYSRVTKAVIGQAVDARNAAIKVNATEFAKEFQKLEEAFLEVTRGIENGEIAAAKKAESDLVDGYSDLELRAIKLHALNAVITQLKKSEAERASSLAPSMYALAQKKLAEADQFITAHRYETTQIQLKANAALFQARRLDQILAQIARLKTLSDEESVLWFETVLHDTTTQLHATDMRDMEWKVQLENIHATIAALQKDNLFLQKKLKDDRTSLEADIADRQQEILGLKDKIALLEGESKEAQKARELLEAKERETQATLEAEHRFQMLFVEVQKLFSKDQAEVYRQGHDLVIRLKAIRFPVGRAFITPDNYDLLSTVRSAIHTFGEPDVVIEGHTDSSGSAAANEKLSQERANAVRKYFVANEAIKPEKVMAIGYGSERPLVKNDTPAGRAINRRIDVIIHTAE